MFDGWTVSGISQFASGPPADISFTVQGLGDAARNRIFTGSETIAPRVVLTGNPNLSGGDRSIDQFIRTDVFALAPIGSVGLDSGARIVRRPGINNWDISIFKDIPYSSNNESRYIQLRLEMFNAFNHTQFSDFNRTVQFDRNGNITNLPSSVGGGGGRFGFGAITAARDPRILQIAAKVYF